MITRNGVVGVTAPEKAKAWVCSKCGEIIFDSSEVILLQELSQGTNKEGG